MAFPTGVRPRVRILTLMTLVALAALGMKLPGWWAAGSLWWREKPFRDAWTAPVTIKVDADDDLLTVLKRVKLATVRWRLPNGLPIYVDPVGLQEAGKTLSTPVATDLEGEGLPTGVFLDRVLGSMGLACHLKDGLVTVTSKESLDAPLGP